MASCSKVPGLNGRSSLRKVRLETGEVVQQQRVDSAYFAEGLTDWNNQLIQLTWQDQIAFVWDLATLRPQRTFSYPGEGWGITRDRTRLILSDGSERLRFFSPEEFRETTRVTVRDGGVAVANLNELEYVRGEIYANIWHSDRVAMIAPESGVVTGWIDLTGLLPARDRLDPEAVLNGIAYDAAGHRLFVTGKLWPKLFEVEIVRR